jgi:hypothetical protein
MRGNNEDQSKKEGETEEKKLRDNIRLSLNKATSNYSGLALPPSLVCIVLVSVTPTVVGKPGCHGAN